MERQRNITGITTILLLSFSLLGASVLLAITLLGTSAQAKPASVLLQEGIYAEEIEGNLDAAIKIYEQVMTEARAAKATAAQATYRIGMCYLKKGEKQKAADYFQKTVTEFGQEQSLATRAREQLAKLKPELRTAGDFGEERFVTLYDIDHPTTKDKVRAIDLDEGRLLKIPEGMDDEECMRWLVDNGIDAVAELTDKAGGLIGFGMVVVPVEPLWWPGMGPAPDQVRSVIGRVPSAPMETTPMMLSDTFPYQPIFAFRTREGGVGVLQVLDADGKPQKVEFRYKMLQEVAPAFAGVARTVFLFDADTANANVVLDLASGELLPAGQGVQQLGIFRDLGKGDLAYDRLLICLRGATAKHFKQDKLAELRIEQQIEDSTAYQLPSAPCRLLVTTAEGERYEVTLLRVTGSGINLEYKQYGVSEQDKLAAENLATQGWQLLYDHKLSEAEEEFKKAVAKDSTNPNAWNGLGWSQFNQGKKLNAKVSFKKCVEIEPAHAAALNGLGWIAKGEGKTEEAIGYWERAVVAMPTATAALNGLATSCMELKQYDKAVKYYQMWLEAEPDNADAQAGLEKARGAAGGPVAPSDKQAAEDFATRGWQLWNQRKLPEAEKAFRKAVAKDPTNANAWNGLGWSQFNQGKRYNAKVSFKKCIEIEPTHAAALNGLGWIAKAENRTDEAIGYWERAVGATPTATAALNGLTTTYMELERYDKAIKYYEMWLKAEPQNADAKAGLEKARAAAAGG